jgi:hypothetical protein
MQCTHSRLNANPLHQCATAFSERCRYLNGSWLSLHLDRMNTHVVSVIMQLEQKVSKKWPLYIIGEQNKHPLE